MSQEADVSMAPRGVGHTSSALAAEAPARLGQLDQLSLRKQRSLWGNAWRQFRRHRLAMAGLVLIVFFILAAYIGTLLYPRTIDEIDFMRVDADPSLSYPFGTDSLGQDMLARILWGGRVSLAVGILAATVAILLGTAIGATAGFFGGFTDSFLMRFTDMFISLPQLPLLLLVSFLFTDRMREVFDEHFGNPNLGVFFLIVGVIAVLNWMPTARLVRASFLSLKEKEFVEAARSIGATRSTLMLKHILPNVLSPIIVAATLSVGSAIITESALSFLGLGFPPDVPTWGTLLFQAKDIFQFHPHEALFPGMVIFLTVLAINYVGDGLRDALDPRKSQ
ncbi:MAG: peptide/nickel transport system permease protein [Thermomicrobiales bacterium]|nr:peptide/nickel transport system permease protein [Thermomicrobiales bacterium]